jgi:hypothetical protein
VEEEAEARRRRRRRRRNRNRNRHRVVIDVVVHPLSLLPSSLTSSSSFT